MSGIRIATRPAFALRLVVPALTALVVAHAGAQSGRAEFLAVTSVGATTNVQLSFNGRAAKTVAAGAFNTTLHVGNKPVGPSFTSYCVDLDGVLKANQVVDALSIESLPGGNGSLVGSIYANFVGQATTTLQQAALQLAIWKMEYDGPTNLNFGSGNIRVVGAPSGLLAQATTYLTTFDPTIRGASFFRVVGNAPGQDLIGPGNAVPEPSSLAMMGMGLGGIFLIWRRRRAGR